MIQGCHPIAVGTDVGFWVCGGDMVERWSQMMSDEYVREYELDQDLEFALAADPFEEVEVELVPLDVIWKSGLVWGIQP